MREQPWVRHGSHQMTTLVFWRKDDNAIIEPNALSVRCALCKLHYTDVSCEWVSCPHLPSILWNSFKETEITTICQMMCNTMTSNSFATVSFATAMLKMKALPTGFTMTFGILLVRTTLKVSSDGCQVCLVVLS